MFQTREVSMSSMAMEIPSLASSSGRCISASFCNIAHRSKQLKLKFKQLLSDKAVNVDIDSYIPWEALSCQGYQCHSASTPSAAETSSSFQLSIPVNK
ncbi:hypothetical protein LINPERPRIM_LOCUS18929 [Linum perenne]